MVDSREFGVAFSERTSNMAGNISTSDGFSPLHPLHPLSPAFHPLLAFVSVHLAWQSQQPKCAMSFCFRLSLDSSFVAFHFLIFLFCFPFCPAQFSWLFLRFSRLWGTFWSNFSRFALFKHVYSPEEIWNGKYLRTHNYLLCVFRGITFNSS